MKYHAILFSSNIRPNDRSTGSHRIATFLRGEGWDVEVIDFAAHWKLEELKELLNSRVSSNTMFFGFSCFISYWNNTLTELTHHMKRSYPNIKILLGGSSIAFAPAPKENVDYWVDGFGEKALLEVVKSIVGNTPSNLMFDVSSFGDKKLIKAIKSYPAYPLDSYKNILEKRDFLKPYEWLTTEFSRGCKFSCTFCNFPILGVKGDNSRTQDDFEEEMKHNYDNFGIKNYFIADETFNDRTEKIIKFADVVDKLNFKPFFSGFMRADLLVTHKDSWDPLIKLGVGGHFYGIESFNHASAKAIKKGMNPDKLKSGLLEVKNYFLERMFYRGTISLIAGLPFETKESLLQTEQWLNNNWQDQNAMIWPLQIEDIDYQNDYTNISEFGKNILNFGIKKMENYDEESLTKIENLWDIEAKFDDYLGDSFHRKELKWEHETMNIIEATAIAGKMQKSIPFNVLPNFSLDKPSMIIGQEVDFPAMRYFDVRLLRKNTKIRIKFLQDYINNKLSV